MRRNPSPREYAAAAAKSMSDLHVFHAVIAILEGGTVHAPSHEASFRIIRICKAESQKRLRDYDKAMDAMERSQRPAPQTPTKETA